MADAVYLTLLPDSTLIIMRLASTFALCLLTLGPTAARATDNNFRPYVLGARAAGMGGAFTALSDDGSGSYYNPGGLAFSTRSSVSLSASVYGIAGGTYEGLFPRNQDFSYSNPQVFPVSTAAVRKLGAVNPDTGVPDQTVFFSVFVPDALRIDDRDTIGTPYNAFFYAQESQTVWAGGGYAYRMGRVGFGAVGYVLYGTEINSFDINVANPEDTRSFVIISSRTDTTTIGFIGGAGVRVDVTDRLRVGASVFSPAVGFGSRGYYAKAAVGEIPGNTTEPRFAAIVNDDLDATPFVPLRVQGGVAWSSPTLTLSADVTWLGAREAEMNPELADQGLNLNLVRKSVINASLGAEMLVADKYPVRAGLFTDFSAAVDPRGRDAGDVANSQHIDRYGVALSVGHRSTNVVTDVGLNLSYGTGKEVLPRQLDFNDLSYQDASQYLIYLFLATAYEF